jgi:alpha-tubulin suppressor-like RCC1 family protein
MFPSIPPGGSCAACHFHEAAAGKPEPLHTCALSLNESSTHPVISKEGTRRSRSGMNSSPVYFEQAQKKFTVELSEMLDEEWLIRKHLFDFYQGPLWITAGFFHSLFLSESGEVLAAGSNTYGQLGLGVAVPTSNNFAHVPLPKEITRVIALAAGLQHSFLLTASGELFATGRNNYGQLGLGDLENRLHFTLVTLPEGVARVVAIAVSGNHSVFLTANGEVFVAGRNNYGQLGLGDTDDKLHFTLVTLPEGAARVVAIAAGVNHSVLLTANGEVFAAGSNAHGQLGLGAAVPTSNNFAHVPLPEGAARIDVIAAGATDTFLLTAEGEVFIAGSNAYGQLGLGDTHDRAYFTPILLPPATRVILLATGGGHNVLVTKSGQVLAAGYNNNGQLGLGNKVNSHFFMPVILSRFTGLEA